MKRKSWKNSVLATQTGSRKQAKIYLITVFRKTHLSPSAALPIVRCAADYRESHDVHLSPWFTCTPRVPLWSGEQSRALTRVPLMKVLASCCCCNKLPQTWWLPTTQVYHPAVLRSEKMVMYGCESWTIKKAERQRIPAFQLRGCGRLLRVPWTARRSNQSILKEISPEYSLEGLMLKLKL